MGVVGDPARTSTLTVAQPFMGLLGNETTSWREPAYANAYFNGCWELYFSGPPDARHYPATGSIYDLRTTLGPQQAPFPWYTGWNNVEMPDCPGHPSAIFTELHNTTQQDVGWLIYF